MVRFYNHDKQICYLVSQNRENYDLFRLKIRKNIFIFASHSKTQMIEMVSLFIIITSR